MSQVTLVSERDLQDIESVSNKIVPDLSDKRKRSASYASRTNSEGSEYSDPPVIHMLKLGDTVKSICLKYRVSVNQRLTTARNPNASKPI